MFKKLVTNLPYSPGLLNQIGFYTKRLKQEEFIRRIGVVFTVLAMLLNINIIFLGPEASVLASPGNDVVTGGIYGDNASELQENAIKAMKNSASTRAIFDYYGITEADIRGTLLTTINTKDESYRSVGRQSFGRGAEVCRTHNGVYFCERSMYAAYRYRELNVRALTGLRQSKVGQSDPWFAILESCGNVVIRIGNDEDISIKKVLPPSQGQEVEVGDIATFRVKISSNNENGAKKLVVKDTLPEHTEYVSHSPADLFDKASVSGRTLTLSSSDSTAGLGPNETETVDIKVRILSTVPPGAQVCNSAEVTSLGDSAITSQSPCVTVSEPEPEPKCVALRLIAGSGIELTRRFEAEVDPDGALVESFVFSFGDSQTETVVTNQSTASVTHDYAQPGDYTINVTVKTSAGDVGGSGTCAKKISISEVPSSISCNSLNVLKVVEETNTFTFEAEASVENASISTFIFDFGDGSSGEVSADGNKATIDHSFIEPGNYSVSVTVIDSEGRETSSSACQIEVEIEPDPCPYDPTLPVDDPNCVKESTGSPNIVMRKRAVNVTQEFEDANGTTAKAGDVVEYYLDTENDGDGDYEGYIIQETLGDVLQYANVVDLDGGTLNEESKIVSWPPVDIAVGETVTKKITVKVMSPIPNTPVSVSDAAAFDLMMENVYGNNVTIKLPPSTPKIVEEAVRDLPETGIGLNVSISTFFFGAVTYFYSRNRLITKELAMIKNEFSGGSA